MRSQLMRPCPVCTSTSTSPVWCTVVACASCGMVYDNRADAMSYEQHDNYALVEPDVVRVKQSMFLLEPFIGDCVMEVGCGAGDLLEKLAQNTVVHIGVEPAEKAIAHCRAKGLNVSAQWPADGMRYDLIVMSHVLEHLTDPREMLERLREFLAHEGHLYVEVPDATRHLDHLTAPLQEFSAVHVNHFSPMLLENLMQRCGLRVIASGTRTLQAGDAGAYPAMWMVAKRAESDFMLPRIMREYAARGERWLAQIAARIIEQLAGEKAILWGAGVMGEHLAPLLAGHVSEIVDRSRGFQGRQLAGVVVTAPPPRTNGPIVIAAFQNGSSIKRDIARLGIKNRVIECL